MRMGVWEIWSMHQNLWRWNQKSISHHHKPGTAWGALSSSCSWRNTWNSAVQWTTMPKWDTKTETVCQNFSVWYTCWLTQFPVSGGMESTGFVVLHVEEGQKCGTPKLLYQPSMVETAQYMSWRQNLTQTVAMNIPVQVYITVLKMFTASLKP